MTTKLKCYDCIHRRDVPGDAHSSCAAPEGTKVVGHPHGIKRGWFFWPHNFDPTWLQECDGFEAKP